jgi:glycosyltransferase involved in cell wall biosynthesis
MGYDCIVVCPRILGKDVLSSAERVPYEVKDQTKNGSMIRVFRPWYLHLSSHKETMGLSMNNHLRAVMGVIRREKLEPDLVYGHFLYQCGLTAARIGEKLGIPSYCACGENSLRLEKGSKPYATGLAYHGWQEIIRKLSGIVCVSGNNEVLLRENGFIDDAMKTGVFPNGVDENKFHILDKARCRRELGLPENAFIVAYTGTFSANKGVDRLSQALNSCPDVWSIFMGQGALEPDCDRILHKGRVPNDQVAKYLNAADVFVLPTRGEGCCNAIVEALSCGLPVISSDLPFNDDILNEENSLRIDVEDVEAIRRSILRLYEDPQLRKALAEGAKNSAKNLKIQARAKRILEFMELSL